MKILFLPCLMSHYVDNDDKRLIIVSYNNDGLYAIIDGEKFSLKTKWRMFDNKKYGFILPKNKDITKIEKEILCLVEKI